MSTTVEMGLIYSKMAFNTDGYALRAPTIKIKIMSVIGINEKIKPNEQELALSKMLFEKELAVVK